MHAIIHSVMECLQTNEIPVVECLKWTEDEPSQIGMEFDIEDKAYNFDNKYGFATKFSVR